MKKIYISWTQINNAVDTLSRILSWTKTTNIKNIYGLPRGGLIPAVMLSHRLNKPLITDKKLITKNTIICDDISDTGKQLAKYKNKNTIVTIHSTPWTKTRPTYYILTKKKKTDWCVYPWEDQK